MNSDPGLKPKPVKFGVSDETSRKTSLFTERNTSHAQTGEKVDVKARPTRDIRASLPREKEETEKGGSFLL